MSNLTGQMPQSPALRRSGSPQPISQAIRPITEQVHAAVLKDKASPGEQTDPPNKSLQPENRFVLKDRETHPRIRPRLNVRLPAGAFDVERIAANWRAENLEAPRVAEAIRLYDAVLQGDVGRIRQIAPLLGPALQATSKRTRIPVLDSDPRSEDSVLRGSTEKGDSDFQNVVQAIADATLTDVIVCRRRVENLARKLRQAGYTGDQVRDWYARWWRVHWWKGRDRHDRPTLADISELIGRVRELSPLPPSRPTPEQSASPVEPMPPAQPPKPEPVPEPAEPSQCVIISSPSPSSALVVPSDDLDVGLLAYAVEASTGTDLYLNPQAKADVRRLYEAGYRAEDVALFVEKVWPTDWRGSDVTATGKPKPRQNLTLKALVEGIGKVKHGLEHSGYDSPGQELYKRIENIRRRVATGEPILSPGDIRSRTWLEAYEARYGDGLDKSSPDEFSPFRTADHKPNLTRGYGVDRWTALMNEMRVVGGAHAYGCYLGRLRLVEISRGEDGVDQFIAYAPTRGVKEWVEGQALSLLQQKLSQYTGRQVKIIIEEDT